MSFNMKKYSELEKYSMAVGKYAIRGKENSACAAPSYKPMIIDESVPNIKSQYDRKKNDFSADGGSVYFRFVAQNTYEEMDTNDRATYDKVNIELAARRAFLNNLDTSGKRPTLSGKPYVDYPIDNSGKTIRIEMPTTLQGAAIQRQIIAFTKQMEDIEGYPTFSQIGEIEALEKTRSKLLEIIKSGNKYNPKSYIEKRIKGNPSLELAWDIVNELKLGLQVPSWVAINWPQIGEWTMKKWDGVEKYGPNDNTKYDVSFFDKETNTTESIYKGWPATPQRYLLGVIGYSPYGNANKTFWPEAIEAKIKSLKGNGFADGELLDSLISRYELFLAIRSNLNSKAPNSTESILYMYDELCKVFFDYHLERYGEGMMVRHSCAIPSNMDPEKSFKFSPRVTSNRPIGDSNPLLIGSKYTDLREVVCTVERAKDTILSKDTIEPILIRDSLLESIGQVPDVTDDRLIEELMVEDIMTLSENGTFARTDPYQLLHGIRNNKVLVCSVKYGNLVQPKDAFGNDIFENSNGEPVEGDYAPSVIWRIGTVLMGDRSQKTSRKVLNQNGEPAVIEGNGVTKISHGNIDTLKNVVIFYNTDDAINYIRRTYKVDVSSVAIQAARSFKPSHEEMIQLSDEIINLTDSGHILITPEYAVRIKRAFAKAAEPISEDVAEYIVDDFSENPTTPQETVTQENPTNIIDEEVSNLEEKPESFRQASVKRTRIIIRKS